MVSLDSMIHWDNFSFDAWIENKKFLQKLVPLPALKNRLEKFYQLPLAKQHVIAESLNILFYLTTDELMISCAVLSFFKDDVSNDAQLIQYPIHLVRMLEQYNQLEKAFFVSALSNSINKENIRKMLLALVDDPRIVVIILIKILAMLRHSKDYTYEEQESLAKISLEICSPIANRLGIGHLKWELEDLAFKIAKTEEYQLLAQHLDLSRTERIQFVRNIVEQIQNILEDHHIEGTVSGRPKHLYSIWKKMKEKGKCFHQIHDLHGVRIIVSNIQDCYKVLGLIHTQWSYLPEEFDDYIANPKSNGYSSIHTAVYGPHQKVFEVQIRTQQMHESAELGVAAHWLYKEDLQQETMYQQKLQNLRRLLQKNEADFEIFDSLKDEIFGDRTYVFTPKGDVFDLPSGSTALDLAYHIHSQVGHHCSGSKVNGKMVPINTTLSNGDTVQIITSSRNQPSRDWLNPHYGYLKTGRARSKVAHWFRSLDKDRLIHDGKVYLEKELKKIGYVLDHYSLDNLLIHFGMKQQKEDFYYAISVGDIKIPKILEVLEPQKHVKMPQVLKEKKNFTVSSEILFGDGLASAQFALARCCLPVFPDPVVGVINRGRPITVHHAQCSTLASNPELCDRLIYAQWRDLTNTIKVSHGIVLLIKGVSRSSLIHDITSTLLSFSVQIDSFESHHSGKTQLTEIETAISISSLASLHHLIDSLGRIGSVIDVKMAGHGTGDLLKA